MDQSNSVQSSIRSIFYVLHIFDRASTLIEKVAARVVEDIVP